MDSARMHIEFRSRINRINSNKNKTYLPQEIDLFLNASMTKFIKDTVSSISPNLGFEDIQERLDDVRTLIKTDSSNSVEGGTLELKSFDRGKRVDLPGNYNHLVRVSADTFNNCFNYKKVPCRSYSNEIIDTILVTEFHRSHVKSPVCNLHNTLIKVYEDRFTVSNIYVTYLTTYPEIVYQVEDCVLPAHTHSDIVDLAVSRVNSVLNSGNYEKYLNEIKNN